MKVLSKQKNSRMCFICGMDNPMRFKSQFYNMEDGSVITPVRYKVEHQSFPQRVHGGLIAAMLDELACRAYWVNGNYTLGVTTSMELKYRKPVPYEEDLFAQGYLIMDKSRMFKTFSKIIDAEGTVFAEATTTYLKLPPEKIAQNVDVHTEMPYLIEDCIKEFHYVSKMN